MQRADASGAQLARALAQDRAHALARADVIAGGEQMAGVQAHPQALVPAGRVQQPGELVERASQRAAGAGRVLQVKLTALAAGQRLSDRLSGARDRLPDVARIGTAGDL